ncbi:MAG TPA: hypothetical protein VGZ26_04900 [Pirellulales bacterium]|nr:hypothetical protein [Pirellulales bacterium]
MTDPLSLERLGYYLDPQRDNITFRICPSSTARSTMVPMNDGLRKNALLSLLCLNRPLDDALGQLHQFSWDSDTELVVLKTSHVQSVLDRFVAGELTSLDVENWANAIEMREDIGIKPGSEALLNQIIFELANPVICAEITHAFAKQLLARLAVEI